MCDRASVDDACQKAGRSSVFDIECQVDVVDCRAFEVREKAACFACAAGERAAAAIDADFVGFCGDKFSAELIKTGPIVDVARAVCVEVAQVDVLSERIDGVRSRFFGCFDKGFCGIDGDGAECGCFAID